MPPQPSGNGTQFAGDDRTQVLAPVGRGNDCGRSWCDLKHLGFEHGHRGDLRHPVFMRPAEQTAVIPVTPAQPEADWDKPELPDCKKKATAMGVLFGAGVVAGVPIGMVLLFVILMAKVAM